MNRIIRFIQIYLITALPFVTIFMIWNTFHNRNQDAVQSMTFLQKIIWEGFLINLTMWFIVLITFLGMLLIIPGVREKTLRHLANLKERDEREQYITGKAARASYIATLSLSIFLLFFSIFSLSIYKQPIQNKQTLSLAIGLHFGFFEKNLEENKNLKIPKENIIFNSDDYTLSTPAILLLLLSWQLITFNFTARKEQHI